MKSSLYGLPHGILHVFNTILYENEFQNPQIFQQTIMSSLFPEHSTLKTLRTRNVNDDDDVVSASKKQQL
jgi:hypothetical protein